MAKYSGTKVSGVDCIYFQINKNRIPLIKLQPKSTELYSHSVVLITDSLAISGKYIIYYRLIPCHNIRLLLK